MSYFTLPTKNNLTINYRLRLLFIFCLFLLGILLLVHHVSVVYNTSLTNKVISISLLFVSSLYTVQGVFTLYWMLYAWENMREIERNKAPKNFDVPFHSFTAIIPARDEAKVIKDTILAVSRINYPEHLKEILIVCREDDTDTIRVVQETLNFLGNENIKLVIFAGFPINKPHGLNVGLQHAKNNIVSVFDAEDEPHPMIYNIINTVLIRDNADVVQSGVQLMNYRSHWFSLLNVLEYYFWFKSALHLFSQRGLVPLGGNTVFFKRSWLQIAGGWDENCLTEDGDIGIRLSVAGAKIKVIYDEEFVTKEETPTSTNGFVKQRTRWNQGFMQILMKKDWLLLPGFTKKIMTLYILGWPEAQSLLIIYIPIMIFAVIRAKIPVTVVMFSFIPLYLFVGQLVVYIIGFYEFTRDFKEKFPLFYPVKLLVTFIPFQILLMISSFRAVMRMMKSKNEWEKTVHANKHRMSGDVKIVGRYATT